MSKRERIAIVDGVRTPFAKVGTGLKTVTADDLGVYPVKELIERGSFSLDEVDELVIGNVAQPAHAANIARVIGLKAGLPEHIPAMTVHRNCASGMESITTAAQRLLLGESNLIIAGGTESMSNIPLLYGKKMTALFDQLMRARTLSKKLAVLSRFRLSFLKPVIGVVQGLTDPVCGLVMGLTAENLAKEFKISRERQDQYALESHQKAVQAQEKGYFKDEIVPVSIGKDADGLLFDDIGPRKTQSLADLEKLRPYFDRKNGTVTVGNACPLTDGAAAVVLMTESESKKRKLKPLGFLNGYAYQGLEPHRMGMGPVYASAKLLKQTGFSMKDIDLVELNEAFSVQALANVIAFGSKSFARQCLGQDEAVGELNPAILNVNGGAVALGHPVGTSGTRIIIHLLKELRRRQLKRGLATLCVGGGQGGAVIVETD